MRKFEIPEYYKSPIISKVRAKRKLDDPRKKDFSPTVLDFGNVQFIVSRHFGFCFGVENAIEKSYRAVHDNPNKRIFLLSQMIHNPGVNADLEKHGVRFIQDTKGNQLIPWSELTNDDIIIIPAFGATIETKNILTEIGVQFEQHDTTCPFVEKVWNRSEKLGNQNHTVIIHGKADHEETKATFSQSKENAPSLILKNMEEAKELGAFLLGERTEEKFNKTFGNKVSFGFDIRKDLNRIGVVNQTTMLASETQSIADYLKSVMIDKYGEVNLSEHFADTRDTLCYATNDNQSATLELLKYEADFSFVVGGYNSSNTTHLVEILENTFPTYFIKDEIEIESDSTLYSFNIHTQEREKHKSFIPTKEKIKVIITSGASCPDSTVDRVIQRILELRNSNVKIDDIVI